MNNLIYNATWGGTKCRPCSWLTPNFNLYQEPSTRQVQGSTATRFYFLARFCAAWMCSTTFIPTRW